MTNLCITSSQADLSIKKEILLPASKSISNRLLMMQAFAGNEFKIENLSLADDTRLLQQALTNLPDVINVVNSGTAFRFLTAFLPMQKGKFTLTGNLAMQNRPVATLVVALRQLGAKIEYAARAGFPPLNIEGSVLQSKPITVSGSVSSQYITALLLIAPYLPEGLTIELIPPVVSSPYIDMTITLMKNAGINVNKLLYKIIVEPGNYRVGNYKCENDWTSASYWFALALLMPGIEIILKNLSRNSIQGDMILAEWFQHWGLDIISKDNDLIVSNRNRRLPQSINLDMAGNPDLAQTLAVMSTLLKIPFRLSGLYHLKIKETDRLQSLQNELGKIGALRCQITDTSITCNEFADMTGTIPEISTYGDHRMAMSFALAATRFEKVMIENPEVVEKSYPHFWEQMQVMGFCYKK